MIDTHCHLTRWKQDFGPVVDRAVSAGIDHMVTIGTEPQDWQAAIEVTRKTANVKCALGVHPNECSEIDPTELEKLRKYSEDPAVVALGEMGFDYHHNYSSRGKQKEFFELQLSLARELGMPVIIHSRDAVHDCLSTLSRYPEVRAVFHCFTGTMAEAKKIWEAGHLTGFTGVVTFKNAQELREVAKAAPADRILLETDAPYLTPEPMRKQKINEPAMVVHTAAVVAQVRGMSVEDLDRLTTDNALGFYRWK
jgi:TatD DNase family protein